MDAIPSDVGKGSKYVISDSNLRLELASVATRDDLATCQTTRARSLNVVLMVTHCAFGLNNKSCGALEKRRHAMSNMMGLLG